MDYYDINMECIKINRKNMYKSICAADNSSTSNHLDDIASVLTRGGEHAIVIKYHSVEYRLNSKYYPVDEAKKWVEQYQFHNLKNVIPMLGLGNGIFAREIINRMNTYDTLLIYEPCSEIFFHVLHNFDITDILSDLRIIIAIENMNKNEFHIRLQGLTDITNMRNQIICIHPRYDKIFIESSISFWKEIKETYQNTQIQINTGIIFGTRFIDNSIKNLKFLKYSNTINELKDIMPKNMPAIVVAAGPSVEKQIENLKKAKGKAVIFAVDRILDYLLEMGLEPDFVVTLDPIKPVEFFSRRSDITIPLLYFLEANDMILESHKGKKILCNCGKFFEKYFSENGKKPPKLMASASVATVAFTACVELGFTNIVLVGQDLAYSGVHSHAGGNDETETETENEMVEDINGNLIKSRYDWRMFITWYQDFITHFPQINVIDVKEQGAMIKGTTIMPLEKVIDTYCNHGDFYINKVEHMEPTFSKEELEKVQNSFKKDIEILKQIKLKSKEAVSLCDSLTNESRKNIASNTIDNQLKKLEKINQYILEQSVYDLMNFYVSAAAAHYISKMYRFTDNMEDNSIQTYQRSKYIFKAIIEASEYIKPKLISAFYDEN